jgi:hypothetical protein
VIGDRFAASCRQVSQVISIATVGSAAASRPSLRVNFALLYVWTAVYASLYSRPLARFFGTVDLNLDGTRTGTGRGSTYRNDHSSVQGSPGG